MQHAKTDEGYVISGTFTEWAAGVPVHGKNKALVESLIQDNADPDDPETRRFLGMGLGSLMDLADQGWPEGVENLRALEDSIREKVADKLFKIRKRRRLVRRGSGNDYDVHASYQGRHDKAWTVSQTTMHSEGAVKQGKTVDICMSLGAHSGIDASAMFFPTACALVAARILLGAGYQVRLFASWRSRRVFKSNKAPRYLVRFVLLSDYGEALDMHGASLLSHGGFCRWFVLMLGACAAAYKPRYALGESQPITYRAMDEGLRMVGMRLGDHVMASPHPGSVSYMDAERAADYVVRDMLGSLV